MPAVKPIDALLGHLATAALARAWVSTQLILKRGDLCAQAPSRAWAHPPLSVTRRCSSSEISAIWRKPRD